MNLFQMGHFLLSSGEETNWKIECDALTQKDWETVAHLVRSRIPRYRSVEGVPRGGLLLATLLFFLKDSDGPLLLVDDVYTTGRSMEALRNGREAVGYVLFARKPVTQPWITALFTLDAKP